MKAKETHENPLGYLETQENKQPCKLTPAIFAVHANITEAEAEETLKEAEAEKRRLNKEFGVQSHKSSKKPHRS